MGRPRQHLTDRQQQRREDILAAARRLISRHGFDGVKMRELAAESGVTPKTLYHQFDSKENLLLRAVEDLFRNTYRDIDAAKIDRGIDRLFYILDAVGDSFRHNEAYARALAPMLSALQQASEFTEIRSAVYRRALEQIAHEGELDEDLDVGQLNRAIIRHVSALYQAWYRGEIPDVETWKQIARAEVSLMLAGVSTGATQAAARQQLARPIVARKDCG